MGVAVLVMAPLAVVVASLAREAAALSANAMKAAEERKTADDGVSSPAGPARPAARDSGAGAPRPRGDAPRDAGARDDGDAAEGEETPAPVEAAEVVAADAWDKFFDKSDRLRRLRDSVDGWLASFGTDSRAVRNQALRAIGKPFATGALGALRGILLASFGFVVMLATLYFLYRDGGKIRSLVIDLSPMPVEQTQRVLDVLRTTAFAAVVGGLATAGVQGALGGIAFAVTGVQAPVFWGFVMAVLSLLPFGGAAFVWAPVAIYFLVTGDAPWKGWFLVGWGALIIGTADNVMRPWLMRRTGAGEVHPLLLFFAVLSGIGLFGFSGVVFGPLIVAFVLVVVQIFREQFGNRSGPRAAVPVPPGPT
jgi:predicted PurR-regulated permease PerM